MASCPCIFLCPSTIDLAWESETDCPENICAFPGSQTQVLILCDLWNLSTKQEDRHTPIIHVFNNQTPPTLITSHSRTYWRLPHLLTCSWQNPFISGGKPGFFHSSHFTCNVARFNSFKLVLPLGWGSFADVGCGGGSKLELCGSQSCSLLSAGHCKCWCHPNPSVRR